MQLRAPPSRSPSHRPAASSGQFSPVYAPGPTYSSIVKETPDGDHSICISKCDSEVEGLSFNAARYHEHTYQVSHWPSSSNIQSIPTVS